MRAPCGSHIEDLESPQITGAALAGRLDELHNRIEDELSWRLYFQIDIEKAEYFEGPSLFGDEVARNFPSAALDIEEAGKCLALGRNAGRVYHLMRVMEVGLRTLSKALGIPYAPSWESYLGQINTRISEKHKKKGIKWKKDEPFFRDLAGDLLTVKFAWRNPTMHIVRNYGPDEAQEIFNAVKSFMKRLATRFSETP